MDSHRWRRPAALLVAVGLSAAACSGGKARQVDKSGRPATGPPVVVGLINMENSPMGAFPELREGALAAGEYLNRQLGGIKGRPIELATCATSGTPESSQSCANRVLEKKPRVVIGGLDFGASASLGILEKAGIPYVGATPTLISELTSPDAFMLNGGAATEVLGEASYLTDALHARKVSVLYLDVPGLLSEAAGIVTDILKKKGVSQVRVSSEKADVADFTPALAAAVSNDPDVVVAVFPAQACSRIMAARAAQGIRAKMVYLGACAEKGVLDAAGQGAEDGYFASGYRPYTDRTDPDVAAYRRQVKAAGHEPSLLSQTGFSLTMDVAALLGESDGEPTPKALLAKLRATRNHSSFMGHSYSCDGDQLPLLSSVCSSYVRILQNHKGSLDDVAGDWVTGAELVKLVA